MKHPAWANSSAPSNCAIDGSFNWPIALTSTAVSIVPSRCHPAFAASIPSACWLSSHRDAVSRVLSRTLSANAELLGNLLQIVLNFLAAARNSGSRRFRGPKEKE